MTPEERIAALEERVALWEGIAKSQLEILSTVKTVLENQQRQLTAAYNALNKLAGDQPPESDVVETKVRVAHLESAFKGLVGALGMVKEALQGHQAGMEAAKAAIDKLAGDEPPETEPEAPVTIN